MATSWQSLKLNVDGLQFLCAIEEGAVFQSDVLEEKVWVGYKNVREVREVRKAFGVDKRKRITPRSVGETLGEDRVCNTE